MGKGEVKQVGPSGCASCLRVGTPASRAVAPLRQPVLQSPRKRKELDRK